MMLNPIYYKELLNSYDSIGCDETNKVTFLSANLILSNYPKQNIHINIPDFSEIYDRILAIIFEKLSISIFQKYADFPPIVVGSKWRHKTKYKKYTFKIIECSKNNIVLKDQEKGLSISKVDEESLFKNYWPAQNRNVQPIKKYRDFFKGYSEWFNIFGTIPTHFSKKVVFISSKATWETCRKHCAPSIYLPNKREDGQVLIKSIPALDDCIAYFTHKYEVCFEQLLDRGKHIDTVVLCDTDLDTIPQILQDQARFNFKLIIVSNRTDNLRFNGILSWNWKKEELNLLEQL